MTANDGRRRQWVPISSDFPNDSLGTRLLDEFGIAGIGVWISLWTAAKRARVQGTVVLGSTELEAWSVLGLEAVSDTFEFTLDEFLRATGQLKQTRKRRRGRIIYVELTRYEEFNNVPRTGSGRKQIPRSGSSKPAPETESSAPETTSNNDRDRDIDSDIDRSEEEEASEFDDFNLQRQRAYTKRLIRKGRDIGSPEAYAQTVAKDPDRVANSHQAWKHRNCPNCKGTGFTHVYAPGAGNVEISCDALEVFESSNLSG